MYKVVIKKIGQVEISQEFSNYQSAKNFLMSLVTPRHIQSFTDEYELYKDARLIESLELKFEAAK